MSLGRDAGVARRADGRSTMKALLDVLPTLPRFSGFGSAQVNFESLVSHRESVQAEATVESVYAHMQTHQHEYVAVLERGRTVGLVSRGHIGFILGSRYGFAIYGRQPVREHLLAHSLHVHLDTPLLAVLERALNREGEEFYEDAVLVGAQEEYLGIISVQTLVRLQTQLIANTTHQVESQRATLAERNRALTQSLDELRRSRGRYDILFQTSALGVALLDRRCRVETHNRRFAALLGLERVQEGFNFCDLVVPSDRQAFLLLVQRQENDGEEEARPQTAHSGEFRLQLPRLGVRQIKLFVSWILETSQICVLLDDVSEQRLIERKLAQKEKSNLLESLVGGIAHELNNKLTPVLMLSELVMEDLQQDTVPKETAQHCASMRSCAVEAARIIRQLLQLSKPVKMELAPCDLGEIIDDTLTILSHRIRQGGINRDIQLPPGKTLVMADAQQIKQVIINLVLNSLDAMETSRRRELTIQVRRENGCQVLCIGDSGCGIAPEHVSRIFDPFFTTKSPDRGTGLGLSVCYSILKQHGGDIQIQSVPGEGTEVRVKIPAATQMPAAPPLAARPPEAPLPKPPPAAAGAGGHRRVLIADDEDVIANMLKLLLGRSLACQVELVADGDIAIERLKSESFNLVICDVRMPRVSGFEVFRWVREQRPEMIGHFFFITGDAGSVDLNEEVEMLGVPVLRKPFETEVLLKQCQLLLKD